MVAMYQPYATYATYTRRQIPLGVLEPADDRPSLAS
ncbi:hypothetical protein BCF44_1345 [Kutzneria buriramensis]|uniref:Uncharacterized protein n=1 Tax=Kutzneria buriramensis TaxID=1045776 RepID=A0A3E0GTA3_9PSEU|nr:hypothetical protein BCF44_1345 [Kutzneria buriramensis]